MKSHVSIPVKSFKFKDCHLVWDAITHMFSQAEVDQALSALPEHVVITMKHYLVSRLTIEEVCKTLNRSPSVLRNRIHFGLFNIQRHFFPDLYKFNSYSI